MKSSPSFRAIALAGLALFLVFSSACNRRKKLLSIDPAFAKYIEAYTSGTVSKTSAITIRLNPDISVSHPVNEPVKEKLFSVHPSVSGTTVWTDERTIEFRPSQNLEPGRLYEVEFFLGKVTDVPSEFKTFRFNVQVLEPSFTVKSLGLKTDGNSREKMIYTGELETADVEDSARVKQIIGAKYQGKEMNIRWMHDAANRRHTFFINDITRAQSASEMEISWNGSSIKAKEKGKENIMVPAVGDFSVMNVMAMNEEENYALVQFSAPISASQDLTGLITMMPDPSASFSVAGSEVKVFSAEPLEGDYTLDIVQGIENIWGGKLEKGHTANLFFENKKPSVQILGRGEILPNSGKVVLPFEAVNLKAVDVTVIRIYERNIPQFLQTNDMDGGSELRRVGKPVVQKTIYLDSDKNLNLTRRNRFALDLDQLIRTEPGAMYRVTIGFRPEYSLYGCSGETGSGENEEEGDEWYDYYYDDYYGGQWSDEDDEFWSLYDNYYPYGYDWEERENPCHPSYYNKERWESRNILASNIGLTVKQGSDKSLLVLVTDLISADPLPGVQLELLDYQQQVITKVTSDNNGEARIEMKKRPFLLVARRNNERAYLKLDDGSSLMMSRFEVEGEEVKEGIKGFIFGERGVWRPGDSIYVSFILEDKENKIPDDHPVEFSLLNPKGQVYKKMVSTKGLNGYYVFPTSTDPSAPTGNWTAKVKVGGAGFEKRIKIETIMPNRLKINLDFGGRQLLGISDEAPVGLSSAWLFGAPARNLRAKVDVTVSRQKTTFEKYKDYEFDNPAIPSGSLVQTVFDGELDNEGKTTFPLLLDEIETAPGFLKAGFTVKVFEPGGAFSIDHVSIPYSPYESYVGIRVPKGEEPFNYLITGKSYPIDIVNVDPKGNRVPGSREVTAELYKVEWKWWWDQSGDDISDYSGSKYSRMVQSAKVTLTNGTGRWSISAPEDGWGRYFLVVRDESGHSSGKVIYFDDPYWQTRSRTDDGGAATMLSFSSDKPRYKVGEKVSLSIPSSEGGRLFISIESGRNVLKTYWLKTEAGQTKFSFTAEGGMAPNIYVNVSLFQPHAQTVNDLPMRMYGVIPVLVDDPNTILRPKIAMPDVIRPEQTTKLTVSEENGKEMTYSIAIVDEGLLDLTRFKTPDPYGYFYSKEALGVKTWDLYDHVIGAWGGQLERILTIGGDEDLYGAGKQKGANRFKPVVKFMGPFHLKRGQKMSHDFTLPPYIGSVRVMVVAEQDAAYGSVEKTVAVKNPLMMLTTLPRVIGPSEQIKIPVTVFASEKHVKNVTVELQNNPWLEVIGERKKTVSFSAIGDQTIYFEARVKPVTGVTKIRLVSVSGNEKAANEIEIEVRNPNPPVTKVDAANISGGSNWKLTAAPIGVPASSSCVLEISSVPPVNLQKRLSYLVQYPHGCIEQITSSVFPQLVLNELMELPEPRKKEIQKNVNAGIRKILNQQMTDGGFSYWRGGRSSDNWGSSYAGHFLLEAKLRGYTVPDDAIRSWIGYQRSAANKWAPSIETFRNYGDDLSQAYRLYVLALAKAPELGAMNRLKEFAYISPQAKWRLAAAYQLAGYTQVASGMIRGLQLEFTDPASPGFTYGSALRDEAMALETLTLLGQQRRAGELVQKISARLSSEEWWSTQTTAYCLIAVAKYSGNNRTDKKITASVTVNGRTVPVNSGAVIVQIPVDVTKGNVPVSVTNSGGNVLYVRLVTEGRPLPGEDVAQARSSQRLKMNVEYLSFDGKPVQVEKVTQGTDFVAKVTVTNPGGYGPYSEMALSQIFPSGWEIMNTRIWDETSAFRSSYYEYQDIRDDRVYTYFDIAEKKTLTYYVMLNAAYMGRYYLPLTVCEAMYDNNISASVSGRWVEVTP